MSIPDKITWDNDIKILSNFFVMRQLYAALGISCAVLFLSVTLINLPDVDSFSDYMASILPIIYISIGFIIAPVLIILIFFKNHYPFTFTLDKKTALMATKKHQRRRNNIISNLLIVLGGLSGKPSALGTGMLAKGNQDMSVKFSKVMVVTCYKKHNTIHLNAGWFQKIYLFCLAENYDGVLSYVRLSAKKTTVFIEK